MRVGLVLGGGGTFGLAYHAGALAALANDCGWDPRDAEVIVGTSAGAIVAALLRSGVPAHDLAASMVGVDLVETPPALAARVTDRPAAPGLGVRGLARLPRLPDVALVARWARRPWAFDPALALVSLLPDGRADLATHVRLLRDWTGGWPDRPLWVTASRHRDLRRVVFGRDGGPVASVREAVAASCAVPGYFAPVAIGGRSYVDGGVGSPTNADVLVGCDLDLVVVLAPLAWRDTRPPLVQRPWRELAARKLRSERRRLSGTAPVVVLAPGAEVTAPFGTALMSGDHLRELTRAAFLDAGRQLAGDGVRERLGARRPAPGRVASRP